MSSDLNKGCTPYIIILLVLYIGQNTARSLCMESQHFFKEHEQQRVHLLKTR